MVGMGEMWSGGMGSTVASLMFLYAMFQQYFPYRLRQRLEKYAQRLFSFVYPYIQITFHEYTGEYFKRSEAYVTIQTYLSSNSSKQAKRLKAEVGKDSKKLTLSMDDHEVVTDEFEGNQFWWSSRRSSPPKQSMSFSFYPTDSDGKRYYKLTCHIRHRGLVIDSYMSHVLKEGKALGVKNRQRKLYTNNPSNNWHGYKSSVWSHVPFNHPSTFQTIAMEDKKKKDIIQDLQTFSTGRDYYAKIGKAWKRGYLLYGPPGTGKSTMIAAIANFLDYDIYDLELTAVKDNTELRKLLINTSNKSVVVIEDIDCSLDLTGQRRKEKEDDEKKEGENPIEKKAKKEASKEESKVTLSGLLNFIDGLWSACGEERLIIFTTNHLEKLDPALIRRGRMDQHIEMSYCTFGAFKVLANNYLDLVSHQLFESIEQLLGETQMTPADVAENLMPKTTEGDFSTVCLENLIEALNNAKEEARLKAEEEQKQGELFAKCESSVAESSAISETKEDDSTLAEDKKNSIENGSV